MTEISLRERKKAQTRDALVEHALRLFRKKGFESTTIDEITDAAQVSRRTFFRYFPSKEAVVFTHREDQFELFKQLLNARGPGESTFTSVRRACLELAKVYAAERELALAHDQLVEATPALVAFERQIDRVWEAEIARTLLDGQRSTQGRHQARVRAGAIFGVIRAVLRDWFDRGGKPDLVRLGTEALDLLENGIGDGVAKATEDGRARRPKRR